MMKEENRNNINVNYIIYLILFLLSALTTTNLFSQGIVINEIMYKPSKEKDCKDWFEIYNPSDKSVNLSAYTVKDDKDEHVWQFPVGTIIAANGYIVVAEDIDEFKKFYSYVKNVTGNFDFGFGKSDQIRLYDVSGKLVDSVAYKNEAPWPEDASGTSKSIELISYTLDNNKGENWHSSLLTLGTPGRENSTVISVGEKEEIQTNVLNIFPNPTSESTRVEFYLNDSGTTFLSIYDTKGVLMSGPEQLKAVKGFNVFELDTRNLPDGAYLVVINQNGNIFTKTLIILH